MSPPSSTYAFTPYTDGSRFLRTKPIKSARFSKVTGLPDDTISASACPLLTVDRARSSSPGSDNSIDWNSTRINRATSSVSLYSKTAPLTSGFQKNATLESPGIASRSNASRFPLSPAETLLSPVIFRPGRARLDTNPVPTGSMLSAITIGIVGVSRLTAAMARYRGGHDHVHLEG